MGPPMPTLAAARIETTEHLGGIRPFPAFREGWRKTGLSEALILKWTDTADLMRVSGVGPQLTELLERVDTVRHAHPQRRASCGQMAKVNAVKKLARVSPPEATITKWIETAKTLESKPGSTGSGWRHVAGVLFRLAPVVYHAPAEGKTTFRRQPREGITDVSYSAHL